MSADDDNELELIAREIEMAQDDPGPLGDDEPEIRPLCRECVRELPDGDDGLCSFCRVVGEVDR